MNMSGLLLSEANEKPDNDFVTLKTRETTALVCLNNPRKPLEKPASSLIKHYVMSPTLTWWRGHDEYLTTWVS